jgi:hypothetical protein
LAVEQTPQLGSSATKQIDVERKKEGEREEEEEALRRRFGQLR